MDTMTVAAHVAAGALGLMIAIPTLLVRKRRRGWHGRLGRVFVVLAMVVALTAFWLVAQAPSELVGLGVLGVLTALWAGSGWALARFRPRVRGGWVRWHVSMMGSAVIAFVTAFAVQVFDGHLAAWLVPTMLGSPLIGRTVQRWSDRPARGREARSPVPTR